MNESQNMNKSRERFLELLDKAQAKYPPISMDELEELGLKCLGYGNCGVSFLTKSNHGIIVNLEVGERFGKISFDNPSCKDKIDEKLLVNAAIRILSGTMPVSIVEIYIYLNILNAKSGDSIDNSI